MKTKTEDNEGAARLRELFPGRGGIKKLAEMFEILPSVASRWYRGERAPDATNRGKLQDRLGIAWGLWDVSPPKGKAA